MPFDTGYKLVVSTPDSLVSDSPFDAILTGIPYCTGLGRKKARIETEGTVTTIECGGPASSARLLLERPRHETIRDAYQDLRNLLALLDLKAAQHTALLLKLNVVHGHVESFPELGPIRRYLRKRAGLPVDVHGFNLQMRNLGDEHALLHDLYDEINETAERVATFLLLMIDGSLGADSYQKYRKDFRIDRWTSCPNI